MAAIGALRPCFAPIETETNAALPAYGDMIVLGGFVSGNITVNFAEGQLYADNVLAEEVRDFISGSIALETSQIDAEAEAVIYAATVDETSGELIYSHEDNPPMGGFGFVRTEQVNGKVRQKGYYFPKVRAALGSETAQTKGSSVTFGTPTTNLTIFKPEYGGWRYSKEFDTEAEAIAWVEEKLGVTAG